MTNVTQLTFPSKSNSKSDRLAVCLAFLRKSWYNSFSDLSDCFCESKNCTKSYVFFNFLIDASFTAVYNIDFLENISTTANETNLNVTCGAYVDVYYKNL